jgi:hypothetical protein
MDEFICESLDNVTDCGDHMIITVPYAEYTEILNHFDTDDLLRYFKEFIVKEEGGSSTLRFSKDDYWKKEAIIGWVINGGFADGYSSVGYIDHDISAVNRLISGESSSERLATSSGFRHYWFHFGEPTGEQCPYAEGDQRKFMVHSLPMRETITVPRYTRSKEEEIGKLMRMLEGYVKYLTYWKEWDKLVFS